MCKGFGAIVTKNLDLYFCEPDNEGDCSHTTILDRLGKQDNADSFLRDFVRVQCPDWTIASFEFDEDSSLPGWADEAAIATLVSKTLGKCALALAEYKKVHAPAWAEYKKVRALALAEYEKVRAPAWAEMITRLSKITGYVPDTKEE
jgi:hypothetical protein